MRPSIVLAILTFFVCSCNNARQCKVQSTDTLKTNLSVTKYFDTTSKSDTTTLSKMPLTLDTLPKVSFGEMTLVSSGQMSPCKTIIIDGHNFDLVTRDKDTIYLTTNDKKFQTPEGYKVGTKFSELPKDIQGELTKEPGWGYYYKLPSGWTLGFCEGNSCTDNFPQNSSEVKWIFKRP